MAAAVTVFTVRAAVVTAPVAKVSADARVAESPAMRAATSADKPVVSVPSTPSARVISDAKPRLAAMEIKVQAEC